MTSLAAPGAQLSAADLADGAREFLVTHDPATTDPVQFLRARFDAGLATGLLPVGLGGLEADPGLQDGVDAIFAAAGSPGNRARDNIVGHGMAGPTILQFGDTRTAEQMDAPAVDRRGSVVPTVQRAPAPDPTWPGWRPARSVTETTGRQWPEGMELDCARGRWGIWWRAPTPRCPSIEG